MHIKVLEYGREKKKEWGGQKTVEKASGENRS